jgi:hypothetical protein
MDFELVISIAIAILVTTAIVWSMNQEPSSDYSEFYQTPMDYYICYMGQKARQEAELEEKSK